MVVMAKTMPKQPCNGFAKPLQGRQSTLRGMTQLDELVGRTVGDLAAAWSASLVALGDKLGSTAGALAAAERKRVAVVATSPEQVTFPLERISLRGSPGRQRTSVGTVIRNSTRGRWANGCV